ncbi:MAG: hypothetical protein ACYDDZ_15720 [Acidimicrobiales bacterium]
MCATTASLAVGAASAPSLQSHVRSSSSSGTCSTIPDAHFADLGTDSYRQRLNEVRRTRELVRQLAAFGHQVTLDPPA